MDYELLFPSKYVKASDFEGKGANYTLTRLKKDEVKDSSGKSESLLVMWFEETDKMFICNKTNATALALTYGRNTDDWIGKVVTLVPSPHDEERDCIRVAKKEKGTWCIYDIKKKEWRPWDKTRLVSRPADPPREEGGG